MHCVERSLVEGISKKKEWSNFCVNAIIVVVRYVVMLPLLSIGTQYSVTVHITIIIKSTLECAIDYYIYLPLKKTNTMTPPLFI